MVVNLTAARNSGNLTTFNVVDSDGVAVNLTTLGATVVTVEVCGPLINSGSGVKIDSGSSDVEFLGDTVSIKFGRLNLRASQTLYYPKISYVTAANTEKQVIAGEGYNTEIKLKVVC